MSSATRKRSRRSPATRRRPSHRRLSHRRRQRGGKKLTPVELLQHFNEASDLISNLIYNNNASNVSLNSNNDVNNTNNANNAKKMMVFEKIKQLYDDNIPDMEHKDWMTLVETPSSPGSQFSPDAKEIKNRIGTISNVFEFWIEVRKQKANNKSGFRRIYNTGTRNAKLKASVKHANIFLNWAKEYIMGYHSPFISRKEKEEAMELVMSLAEMMKKVK